LNDVSGSSLRVDAYPVTTIEMKGERDVRHAYGFIAPPPSGALSSEIVAHLDLDSVTSTIAFDIGFLPVL